MMIRYWKEVEDAVWWQIAEECDFATFYHTPAWHYLVQESMPGTQVKTIGGELESGTRFILPLLTTKRVGPFHGLVSSAENVYGGVITDGPITEDEKKQIYKDVARKWQVINFRFLPSPIDQLESPVEGFVPEPDTTFLVSLEQGYDEIYRKFTNDPRRNIKKALKANIVVEAGASLEDYEALYQVYLDSVSRWGESIIGDIVPWPMFEKIHGLSQEMPGKVRLWLARLDGKVISGAINFHWNQLIVGYLAANQREYMSYGTMTLLVNEMLKDAAQDEGGYRYLDMGGSGANEGVYKFKQRFGGIAAPQSWWFYTHPLLDTMYKLRYKLSGK